MNINALTKVYNKLTLFDQKILSGIVKQVNPDDEDTKAYTIRLIDFELDHLNPSDITQKMKRLTKVTVKLEIDGQDALVPLLTHFQYDDHSKTVTLTFNSILKPYYIKLKKELKKVSFL